MCLCLIGIQQHPEFDLVIAANRDEFYSRPSQPPHIWETKPIVIAGKDLQDGGTWMGISEDGKVAVITNFRDPHLTRDGLKSRGDIVRKYLTEHFSDEEFLFWLEKNKGDFNPFNIIFGRGTNLIVFSNVSGTFQKLNLGIFGLSNHFIDTPWPKVLMSKENFSNALKKDSLETEIMKLMSNTLVFPDNQLPSTGFSLDWERSLSSIFVQRPEYGTRSTTLILRKPSGKTLFFEHIFNERGIKMSESRYEI